MKLHIFNPEHDIALSANNDFWTAPHAGRQLRSDLCWLPAIWSEEGDVVLVEDVEYALLAQKKAGVGRKGIRFVNMRDRNAVLQLNAMAEEVCPWGWDRNIVHILNKSGIDRSKMPSPESLEFFREVSDRRTSSMLLADIRKDIGGLCGEAHVLTEFPDLLRHVAMWDKVVLKSPWSSSGRGVRYVSDISETTKRWVMKVLRTMGHIMVEPMLDKILDFGMEYNVLSNGEVEYCGLSLFKTVHGAYEGSILALEEEKEELLERYVDKQLLLDVQRYIASWMKEKLNGRYHGPFGVDMMIVRTVDNAGTPHIAIDPCVEINLRRTMGHVALSLSPTERGKEEVMQIAYEGTGYHFRKFTDHELLF